MKERLKAALRKFIVGIKKKVFYWGDDQVLEQAPQGSDYGPKSVSVQEVFEQCSLHTWFNS